VALSLAFGLGGETRAASAISVEQPFARATPGRATTGAAYIMLINGGTSADRLVGAATPVADNVQFHKVTEDNGVSRMRQVQGVELAPGAKIIFKPGEMHMMLVGLKQPLIEGQTFPLTLQFEQAGRVEVPVPINRVGAMQHDDMGSMMHMHEDATKK
jgi:copper(I)-binding protein